MSARTLIQRLIGSMLLICGVLVILLEYIM